MKILKVIGFSVVSILTTVIVGLIILGNIVPETYVYYGHQVPQRYLKDIKDLGLIGENEKIKYFYTDAFIDIREGFYFVSDQKLVLYCEEWDEPAIKIDLKEIISVDAKQNDSFLEDSTVFVETKSGLDFTFPLSSEQGRDQAFVKYLKSHGEKGSELLQ